MSVWDVENVGAVSAPTPATALQMGPSSPEDTPAGSFTPEAACCAAGAAGAAAVGFSAALPPLATTEARRLAQEMGPPLLEAAAEKQSTCQVSI